MKKYSPEVLLYVSKIKHFIKNNLEASTYFLTDTDEKTFFECIADKSQRIFDERKIPELNEEEFNEVKRTIEIVKVIKPKIKGPFMEIKNFPPICLN